MLRPGVLAGHEAYAQWEARLLTDFLTPVVHGRTPLTAALAGMLCWSDTLRAWRPRDGALEVLARRPLAPVDAVRLLRHGADEQGLQTILSALLSRVPREWRPVAWPLGLTDAAAGGPAVTRAQAETALARYLATRLVGSWVAYQGAGVRSVAASLVSAYVLVTLALAAEVPENIGSHVTIGHLTSALRASDWLLLHLLDREDWAAWCTEYEAAADARPLLELISGSARLLDALSWETPT